MGMGARQPGCFRYGCFIATILTVVVFGSLTWWSLRSVRQAFEFYTSDAPSVLAGVHSVSDSAVEQGRAKWQQLADAYKGNASTHVVFTADELRGAMQGMRFHNTVDVGVDGDEITARFSVPLSLFGEWTAAQKLVGSVKDRFLTGEIVGAVSIIDNSPTIDCERLVLNGSVLEEMARGHAASWLEGAVRSVIQSRRETSNISKLVVANSLLAVTLAKDSSEDSL